MTTILAIDPGASGGFAVQCGSLSVAAFPMPETEGDVLETIKGWTKLEGDGVPERIAYVEEVSGFCGEGQPGSAMFKFGRGFGFILGVLQAFDWTIQLVKPQKWQKALSLGTKAETGGRVAWKNKLKAEAQRLYPGLKVTLKTADSLLLLKYARSTRPPSATSEFKLPA